MVTYPPYSLCVFLMRGIGFKMPSWLRTFDANLLGGLSLCIMKDRYFFLSPLIEHGKANGHRSSLLKGVVTN